MVGTALQSDISIINELQYMEGTIFSVLPDDVVVQILLRVRTRSLGKL